MLRATGYLSHMLSVERFDGNCRPMYALRGPVATRQSVRLTRIVMYVIGGLVSGDDMFTRPSVAQLTVLSTSEGKHWDRCQRSEVCVCHPLTSTLVR